MIHCCGWKRLEANRMFSFDSVGEKNFNSNLRRALVYRIKARFEDPHVIEAAYDDIHKDGVFPKDPDLHHFLTSSAAVAAGLQLQHGFEMKFDKQQCIDLIENYVNFGGDHGLTEDVMRTACKLPPKNRRVAATAAAAVINVDAEPDEQEEERKSWKVLHEAVCEFLVIKRKVFATQHMLNAMKMPRAGPNVAKDAMAKGLEQMGLLLACPGSGKTDVQYVPQVQAKVGLSSLIQHTVREHALSLPEVYNIDAFSQYMYGGSFRRENTEILADVLRNLSGLRKKAGRTSAEEKSMKEAMQEKARKMQEAETLGDNLLELLDPEKQKKRRRRTKGRESEVKEEHATGAASSAARTPGKQQVSYHYSDSCPGVRSRQYADGPAAQKFSRRAQMVLFADTHDLDIETSLFTLMSQLLDRLDLQPAMMEDAQDAFKKCASERSLVCRDVLQMATAEGKQALVSILYGGHAPQAIANLDFYTRIAESFRVLSLGRSFPPTIRIYNIVE